MYSDRDRRKDSLQDDEGTPLLQNNRLRRGSSLLCEEDDDPEAADPAPSLSQKPLASLGAALKDVKRKNILKKSDSKGKLVLYAHDSLLSARSLLEIGQSVLFQKPVAQTFIFCMIVTATTATITFFIPRASTLDIERFDTFAMFLKVFISFMLGVYTAQSFNRWRYTVTAFEKFLISIRQMVFMLHALRVHPRWREQVEAYCIASGYIFNCEVRNAQHTNPENFASTNEVLDTLLEEGRLNLDEVQQLQKHGQHSLGQTRAIWTWISALISHPVSMDEKVVLPQLLVRTIQLCQNCIGEIDGMKMNITMQMPWIYANLLAVLVHANNAILSVTCGITIGSSINEIRRRNEQLHGIRETKVPHEQLIQEIYGALQALASQILIVMLTPILYVSFLHLANQLCLPFGDDAHCLPTESWIHGLALELDDMARNRQYFRDKHKDMTYQDMGDRMKHPMNMEEWAKFDCCDCD